MKRLVIVLGMLLIEGGFGGEKGETVAAFLKIGGGSRAAGMADCFTGLSDDVSASYFNPGGLSQLTSKEGLFMFLRPMGRVEGLLMSFGSIAIPQPYGVVGLAFTYYGYGETDRVDDSGKKDGSKWSAYDFALLTSFARNIREDLGLGASIKVINGKIDDETAIAFALDFGGLYKTPKKGLNLGFAIKNLGPKMTYDKEGFPLPLSLNVGVSYKLARDLLLLLFDLTIPNDNSPYIGIGCEYKPTEIFSIRGGYKTGPHDEGPGFTLGLGTQYSIYNFDYAYQPFGKLGDSHKVSVLAKF